MIFVKHARNQSIVTIVYQSHIITNSDIYKLVSIVLSIVCCQDTVFILRVRWNCNIRKYDSLIVNHQYFDSEFNGTAGTNYL